MTKIKSKNIDVDIFKGKINTFITLKYKPTKVVIAKCIPNSWNLTKYLKKLSIEFKNRIGE